MRKVPGLPVFALALLAVLSAAPAFAEETTPQALPAVGAAASIPVTCGLNLPALNQPVKGETCAAQPESKLPDLLSTSKRLGYCHCGCVNQRVCRTSEDCGGASCDQFISCC
jgi:hypothetical protein